jgi:adenosylcobinamide-GDP ribazoletransferase
MGQAFLCALGFLTRLPAPHGTLSEADVARSAGFFPWVGGLIALLLAGAAWMLGPLGPRVAALALVAVWALLSGALHLDGLADTFDGLGGGRGERARTLEIMRDSRIGAHGATALVLVLGLKWAALERVLELGLGAWLAAPVVARLVATVLLASFPYARHQGLGSAFSGRVGLREVAVGCLALLPLAWLFRLGFALPALLGAAVALVLALRMHRLLGGLTGDVHGAAIELCETALLVGLPVLPALGLPGG